MHTPERLCAIRPARIADAGAISELILALAEQFISDPRAPEVATFLETLSPEATAERIESREFDCRVAERNGEVCGVIVMRNTSHLYHLFVRSDMHRQGIGRALWDHVLAQADGSSFTVNSSINAQPVYERFGFRATDQPQTQNGLTFVPMKYDGKPGDSTHAD